MNSQDSFSDKKALLIDIGGTNIRTATAYIGSNEINNASKQNLNCLDSFDEIIQNLLSKDQNIKHIVFSVAGPKVNQSISMTNRDFEIDEMDVDDIVSKLVEDKLMQVTQPHEKESNVVAQRVGPFRAPPLGR